MFSKTLLLLALCFQAFHADGPLRFLEKIHGGLEMGKALKVEVCDSELYPEFIIRLFSYKTAREVSDVGLKLRVSAAEGKIFFDSMVNGMWKNSSNFSWQKAEDPHRVSLEVVVEESYFNVIVFDRESYARNYLIPTDNLNYWEIEYRQEYQVATTIWHRKFYPCDTCPKC